MMLFSFTWFQTLNKQSHKRAKELKDNHEQYYSRRRVSFRRTCCRSHRAACLVPFDVRHRSHGQFISLYNSLGGKEQNVSFCMLTLMLMVVLCAYAIPAISSITILFCVVVVLEFCVVLLLTP